MDLASAYVLRPLNRLVQDFEVCDRGQTNKWKSRGVLDWSLLEGAWRVRGGVEVVNLIGDNIANGLELRG